MMELLQLPRRKREIVDGRVPFDGYQRGIALEFRGHVELAKQDPLFMAAFEASAGRSVLHFPRLVNLYLLLTHFIGELPSQNIIEFGSFRGGSTLFMAYLLKQLYPKARLYSLDTFAGMPETEDIDTHRKGNFKDVDIDGFREQIDKFKLDNIEIHQGLFQDSFPKIASTGTTFGLAHLDADIYSAIKYAQDAVWPHMTKGGYLVYDDATVASCLGATQAVEDMIIERRIHCEQISPHFVFRVGLK